MKESDIEKLKKQNRHQFNISILCYTFAMTSAFWNLGLYTIAPNRVQLYSTFISTLPMIAVAIYVIIDMWENSGTHN